MQILMLFVLLLLKKSSSTKTLTTVHAKTSSRSHNQKPLLSFEFNIRETSFDAAILHHFQAHSPTLWRKRIIIIKRPIFDICLTYDGRILVNWINITMNTFVYNVSCDMIPICINREKYSFWKKHKCKFIIWSSAGYNTGCIGFCPIDIIPVSCFLFFVLCKTLCNIGFWKVLYKQTLIY